MSKRKTQAVFLSELEAINNSIIPEGDYINNHTKIQCRCKICGHIWHVRPNALLRGYGCPNCAGNIKKSHSTFIKELSLVNPDIIPIEEYQNSKTPIKCKCKVCGNEWRAAPNNLLSKGHKCPQCSRIERGIKRRKTNDDFVRELSEISPNIIPLEPYTTNQKSIKCKCKLCGFSWSATPNNLLDKRSRCPNCSHASTSIVEQILKEAFSVALGKTAVLSRDKTIIGKELDIVIPRLDLAIEYGAWFWHKNRLKKDNEKHQLCYEKGVHLITILEECPEDIHIELSGDYRLFRESISNEKDYHTIKIIISNLCMEYGISIEIIEKEWGRIVESAIESARKIDADSFQKQLQMVNPTVSLLEQYTRSVDKIKCRCNNCGHEWKALPSSLMQGHGCPKCARTVTGAKKTYTNEEFLSRLHSINDTIEPLEAYVKGDLVIQCKCKQCGFVWSVKPHALLQGRGCPKCARNHATELQSKPIRCVETGVCYKSIAEVQRLTGIYGVHKVAKGYQKTAGGYHWEYVE